MLTKIYLEITNVCNLSCSFCHGTSRKKHFTTTDEFSSILDKISGKARFLYLHLLGEPLLHPNASSFAKMAKNAGFEVMLTTNGTLLDSNGQFIITDKSVKKVSISLQSVDIVDGKMLASTEKQLDEYLQSVYDFSKSCAKNGVICVLRLWNLDDDPNKNNSILSRLHTLYPDEWIPNRQGFKLFASPKGKDEVFLEFGNKFTWPDLSLEQRPVFDCRAIKDQIGILCDGTVVPCCLDADGCIALGSIFKSSLDEILSSERAVALQRSFEAHSPCEKLCLTCGFAQQFN